MTVHLTQCKLCTAASIIIVLIRVKSDHNTPKTIPGVDITQNGQRKMKYLQFLAELVLRFWIFENVVEECYAYAEVEVVIEQHVEQPNLIFHVSPLPPPYIPFFM